MLRAAILSALLVSPAWAAPLDAGEAYEACLVGRFVIERAEKAFDPFGAALDSCSELAAAVPPDYPGEEAESYGAALAEENAMHFIDHILPTIDGELGAEY